MGKTQEVERVGFMLVSIDLMHYSPAKINYTGLLRVQLKVELLEPLLQ